MSTSYPSHHEPQILQLQRDLAALSDRHDKAIAVVERELVLARRKIYDLSTMIVALTEQLGKSNGLDIDAFSTAVGDALAAGPFSIEHPEPTNADLPSTCTRCWCAVPTSATTMTATGLVCDRCSR